MSNIITLKLNKEFKRAYYRGEPMFSNLVVTYALKNRLNKNRIGITTSKKIGGAVQRNRARRVIKEAYRQIANCLKSGFDIVFVARTGATKCKTNDILKIIVYHTKKMGIWK